MGNYNNKNILTEVNRMKQIMGVQLINEGWDDIIRLILGVSKDSSDDIVKKSGNDIGNYSSDLSKIVGGNSLSDVTSYLTKQGIGVSDTDIVNWIKTQPTIIDQIAKSSDQIMKQAIDIVFTKLKVNQILTKDSIELINDILLTDITRLNISELNYVINDLIKLNNKNYNTNLDNLIKQLQDKKKLLENLNSSKNHNNIVKSTDNFIPSPNAKSYLESFAYNNPNSFIQMVNGKPMSGWKIHIYGDSVEDSAKLITKLDDFLNSSQSSYKIATDKFFKNTLGTKQQGKALTIYIPYDVVKNGKQSEYFETISQKLGDYNKSGEISGDKSYNNIIHYRYEYNQPFDALPEGGVTNVNAGKYYESNEGDYMSGTGELQPDLFKRNSTTINTNIKQTLDSLSGKRISNISFDDSNINWGNITNAKNMNDYNKIISNAIQTKDYSRISRGGFEKYGINNFREYLMNNISKINDIDTSTGRWSVNFK